MYVWPVEKSAKLVRSIEQGSAGTGRGLRAMPPIETKNDKWQMTHFPWTTRYSAKKNNRKEEQTNAWTEQREVTLERKMAPWIGVAPL